MMMLSPKPALIFRCLSPARSLHSSTESSPSTSELGEVVPLLPVRCDEIVLTHTLSLLGVWLTPAGLYQWLCRSLDVKVAVRAMESPAVGPAVSAQRAFGGGADVIKKLQT